MKKTTTLLLLLISITSFSQKITGNELLEKAIQFHDPKGNWETFKGELFFNKKIILLDSSVKLTFSQVHSKVSIYGSYC